MIVLGLTGSIGMGKSTTAKMFADAGVPVWDADACVHRLYSRDSAGASAIAKLAPDAVGEDGVDRTALRSAILDDPGLLKRIEAVIHPLVAADREAFLNSARLEGATVALCDIPLLFETGAEAWLDQVAVVTAPMEVQHARVMERPGMTEETFQAILDKQVPDAEKRARADFVIDTSRGLDTARSQVEKLLESLDA